MEKAAHAVAAADAAAELERAEIAGGVSSYFTAVRASVAKLGPDMQRAYAETGLPLYESGVDGELSARLTVKARGLLKSEHVLVVAYDLSGAGLAHECSYSINTRKMVYGAGGYQGVCIEMGCRKSAALVLEILENDRLADLRKGVLKSLLHEAGHIRALRSSATFGNDAAASESMAEAYAMAKTKTYGVKPEDAAAALLAIGAYLDSNHSIHNKILDSLAHYNDRPDIPGAVFGNEGCTAAVYGGDMAGAAGAMYAKLVGALGEPDGAGALRK